MNNSISIKLTVIKNISGEFFSIIFSKLFANKIGIINNENNKKRTIIIKWA